MLEPLQGQSISKYIQQSTINKLKGHCKNMDLVGIIEIPRKRDCMLVLFLCLEFEPKKMNMVPCIKLGLLPSSQKCEELLPNRRSLSYVAKKVVP